MYTSHPSYLFRKTSVFRLIFNFVIIGLYSGKVSLFIHLNQKEMNKNKLRRKSYTKLVLWLMLSLSFILYMLIIKLHKYEVWYNTYRLERTEFPDKWEVDFINNHATEYSWYDSINANEIAEFHYCSEFSNNLDSLHVIAVLKDNQIIYTCDERN